MEIRKEFNFGFTLPEVFFMLAVFFGILALLGMYVDPQWLTDWLDKPMRDATIKDAFYMALVAWIFAK